MDNFEKKFAEQGVDLSTQCVFVEILVAVDLLDASGGFVYAVPKLQ